MFHRKSASIAVAAMLAAFAVAAPALAADDCPPPDLSWVKKYPKWIQDRQAETQKNMDPKVYRDAMCSLKNMERNPDVDTQPAGSVYIEENWQVEPENWKQWREAYDKEVYAYARKVPGYRGMVMMTTLLPGKDEPIEQQNGGGWGNDKKAISRFTLGDGPNGMEFIKPHPNLQLKGVRHDRSISWDSLFFRTFNVRVIHFVQTWPQADQFEAQKAKLFADANGGGEPYHERLAKTVYALSDNHWSTTLRLVRTSWEWERPVQKGNDADGLNLDRHKDGPVIMVHEHWDVKPDRFCQFLADMERNVEAYDRHDIGEKGITYATSLPPQLCEPGAEPLTAEGMRRLGGDDDLYVPEPGVMIDGKVRTNYAINVGALYKKTYNVVLLRRFKTFAAQGLQSQFEEGSRSNYAKNAGMSETDQFESKWQTELMHNSNNHWDTWYRVVHTSYVPEKPKAAGK